MSTSIEIFKFKRKKKSSTLATGRKSRVYTNFTFADWMEEKKREISNFHFSLDFEVDGTLEAADFGARTRNSKAEIINTH